MWHDCRVSIATNKPREAFAADCLATGLAVMLAMTVVQRGIGFLRGIWFCRLLDDSVVGQWAMAFGFITAVTPLMMLGLPGAMPRFVERYRVAGHLTKFLRRVVIGTLAGTSLVIVAMALAPQWFGQLIFRQATGVGLVWAVGTAALATLVFNFVNELASSLRQVRLVSMMQFVQGVGFTFLGVGAIYGGGGLLEVTLAYTAATLLATTPGLWVLLRNWPDLPTSESTFESATMWRSLLPYAITLWLMNLLTNAFELSDRYMILHFYTGDDAAATSAVGQYHSGRLIPTLLTSLAAMLVGVLLPYLVADWEEGRRQWVQERLRRVLFLVSASFTLCAGIAIALSPILFDSLLESRYHDGLAIQPVAFTFCIWGSLVTVAQTFLWVRERGNLIGVVLALGLVTNLGLNACWIPTSGLAGAVYATLVANAVLLVGTGLILRRVGFKLDASSLWVALLPLSLVFGWGVAVAASIASLVLFRDAGVWISESIAMGSVSRRLAR